MFSNRNFEQQINVTFCVKLRNSATEACEMLSEPKGTEAVNTSSAFEYSAVVYDMLGGKSGEAVG
jgi:hypothetical protein